MFSILLNFLKSLIEIFYPFFTFFDKCERSLGLNNIYKNISNFRALYKVRRYNKIKNTRSAKVVVYTAITGDYEGGVLFPEYVEDDWDYVLFTEAELNDPSVFELRKIPFKDNDPVRVARYVKLNPHILLKEYDYALWIDGNVLLKKGVVAEVQEHINKKHDLVFRKHPIRDSVFDEIYACQKLRKDDFSLMKWQMDKYRDDLYFQKSDFFETNVILRNLRSERVSSFNERWWGELSSGSRRDQLSVNYSLDNVGSDYFLFNERCDIRKKSNPLYYLFSHRKLRDKKKLFFSPFYMSSFKESPFSVKDFIYNVSSVDFFDEALDKRFIGSSLEEEINERLKVFGLSKIRLIGERGNRFIDSIYSAAPIHDYQYVKSECKVTAFLLCFHNYDNFEKSVMSLMAQSWSNIEIVCVVGSDLDETAERIEDLKVLDDRVKLIRSKNLQSFYEDEVFLLEGGDYIFSSSSGEWYHPQNIEYQVNNLIGNEKLSFSVSSCFRVLPSLASNSQYFDLFKELNVSSIMSSKENFLKVLNTCNTQFKDEADLYESINKFDSNAVAKLLATTSFKF